MTITHKFVLVVILLIGFLLMVSLYSSRIILEGYVLRAADDLAFSILDRTDRQIVQYFGDLESLLIGYASTAFVREIRPDLMKDMFLSQVLSRRQYVRSMYLGTADGRMFEYGHGSGYVDNEAVFPNAYDPRVRPWYRLAVFTGGFAVTEPYQYANIDAMGITCSYPLYDDTHTLIGVLGVDILVERLVAVLEGLALPKNAQVAILDRQGVMLASQFENPERLLAQLEQIDHTQQSTRSITYQGAFRIRLNEQDYRLVYRKLDTYKLTVVVAMPYRSIMSNTQELLRLVSTVDLLIVSCMIVLVAAITARMVVQPLNAMVRVVERKKNGQQNARININSQDEFGILGTELNTLFDTVDAEADRLEEMVRERTLEIVQLQRENTILRVNEERKRILQDLHDAIGAKLTNIFFCNSVARARLAEDGTVPADMLQSIDANCVAAVQSLKEIVSGMRADDRLAKDSLRLLLLNIRQRLQTAGIAFDAKIAGHHLYNDLSPDIRQELSQVFEELVSNVLKHAEAKTVRLRMRTNRTGLSILFTDDGRGFLKPRGHSGIHGLITIRERIKRAGGRISCRSDKGTSYRIRIPKEQAT